MQTEWECVFPPFQICLRIVIRFYFYLIDWLIDWGRVSFCSPGWSRDPSANTSWVLGLKERVAIPSMQGILRTLDLFLDFRISRSCLKITIPQSAATKRRCHRRNKNEWKFITDKKGRPAIGRGSGTKMQAAFRGEAFLFFPRQGRRLPVRMCYLACGSKHSYIFVLSLHWQSAHYANVL
jgi:hypothetical protein